MIVEKEESFPETEYGFSGKLYNEKNIKELEKETSSLYITLAFCKKGRLSMCQNGEIYSFGRGDLAIINAETPYFIKSLDIGCELIVITFNPDMLSDGTENKGGQKFSAPFTSGENPRQKIFSFVETEHTFIPTAIEKIYEEYSKKSYGFELAAKAEICRIFLWILRYWNNLGMEITPRRKGSKKIYEKMSVVFEYIKNNCEENIDSADMAKLCGISPWYFSRMFKEITKKSFSDYLNSARIAKAEKMLAETEKSITEISYSCGFSTSSYFIRQFKKQKGTSPRRYRTDMLSLGEKADYGL